MSVIDQMPQKKTPPPPPQPQLPQVTEEIFPEDLRKGGPIRRPLGDLGAKSVPEHIQKREKEIKEYYGKTPEDERVYPAPKKSNLRTMLSIGFIVLIMGAVGLSFMNIVYARGSANLATSMSYLHLEVALIGIALMIGFTILDGR